MRKEWMPVRLNGSRLLGEGLEIFKGKETVLRFPWGRPDNPIPLDADTSLNTPALSPVAANLCLKSAVVLG